MSLRQVSFLVVIFLLVGAVTFMVNYTGTPRDKDRPVGPGAVSQHLEFFNPFADLPTTGTPDPLDPNQVDVIEVNSDGHYDFWFRNTRNEPVAIKVQEKTCVCTEVLVAELPPGSFDESAPQAAQLAVPAALAGPASWALSVPPWLPALNKLPEKLIWKELETKGGSASADLSPGRPGAPTVGFVRMTWRVREPGQRKLDVKIRTSTAAPGDVADQILSCGVGVTPALVVSPSTLDFADLRPGDQRTLEMSVWSLTRKDLQIRPIELAASEFFGGDECIVVGKPVPMTVEDKRELTAKIGKAFEHKAKVQSGWKVPVTLHESRNGKQLDMGTLNRQLVVQTDDGVEAVRPSLQGMIRGEVRVENAGPRDTVQLGGFPHRQGVTRSVTLVGAAGLDLKVERHAPQVLNVDLRPLDIPGRWKLTLSVAPNALLGEINQGVVVLTTGGSAPRRIRIPVTGAGTQ